MELVSLSKRFRAACGTGTACRDRELPALFVDGPIYLPSIAHGLINPATGVFLLLDVVAERLECLVVGSVHLAGPAVDDEEAPRQLCRDRSRPEVLRLRSVSCSTPF